MKKKKATKKTVKKSIKKVVKKIIKKSVKKKSMSLTPSDKKMVLTKKPVFQIKPKGSQPFKMPGAKIT